MMQTANSAAKAVMPAPVQAPYTAMLREYGAAAKKLEQRLLELRAALRTLQEAHAAPPELTALERRILLLRDERAEIAAAMEAIGEYAAMEVQQ